MSFQVKLDDRWLRRHHRDYGPSGRKFDLAKAVKDADVLTAGKALEMITIDAARALGLDAELGSLEEGKKADVVVIDAVKPHLYPLWQEPLRIVYQASGHDVDTVIVDGRIVMENRIAQTVDEAAILADAQVEAEKMLDRTGFQRSAQLPERFWKSTHY